MKEEEEKLNLLCVGDIVFIYKVVSVELWADSGQNQMALFDSFVRRRISWRFYCGCGCGFFFG